MRGKGISSDQKPVSEVLSSIKGGDIKIPNFQRGFVWDRDQVIRLFDSIYKDYPIGSLLFWETTEELDSLRNIGGVKLPLPDPEYPKLYVLDGQQRLSTLYAALNHDLPKADKEDTEAGIENYELFDIHFDLDNEYFLHRSEIPEPSESTLFEQDGDYKGQHRYISLSNLKSLSDVMDAIDGRPDQYVEKAKELYTKFIEYKIPIVTVKGREREDVGTIFERINNSGTDLDTIDLTTAWTYTSEFNLRKKINSINEIFEKSGFNIKKDRILQSLSASITSRVSTDDIFESLEDTATVERNVEKVKVGSKRTIDFVKRNFNLNSSYLLPSGFQIIPLVYFFSKVKSPSTRQVEYIKKWFWKTSFTSRYRDNTTYRVHEDISLFDDIINLTSPSLNDYKTDVKTDKFFATRTFRTRASVVKAFILMLANRGPRDISNGKQITVDEPLEPRNRSEYHHVFPSSFLASRGYNDDYVNCLSNICLITSQSNKEISDSPPSDYMFEHQSDIFSDNAKSRVGKDVLSSNLLPTDMSLYRNNKYEEFIDTRSTILFDYYEELVG